MSLKRRVRALERVVGRTDDKRCEACGYDPGVRPEFKVSMHDEPLDGPEVCPKCGRRLIIRLEFERPLQQIEASRKSRG